MPGPPPPLSIAVVLPRGMRFSPQGATSIDLCAADFVRHSRHAARTRVICAAVDAPFEGFDVAMVGGGRTGAPLHRLRTCVETFDPSLIVVHQHAPTAAALALRQPRPVVLHTHAFAKPPGWPLRRAYKTRQYRALAGMVFVSRACADDFAANWPHVATPRIVVHNALDTAAWSATRPREPLIALAGRATPEKGVLDATQAVARVLRRYPHWRATLALSATTAAPDYLRAVAAAAAQAGDAVEIVTEAPFAQVQALFERAAIALTPSRYRESFGRTALEAHAGGAALISTGRGGLQEVSGDACLYAPAGDPDAWEAAIERLIVDDRLRASLAEAGRRRAVDLFDIHAACAALDGFYEAVLQRRGRAP